MIIIDPALPFIEGLEAIKQLQRYKPDLQFIVFMQENCTINLEEFIKLNIQGITLKDSNTTSLLSAIHSVCRGFTFLDKALTPYANRSINSLDIHSLNNTLSLPRISPREKQILGLISQGLRNKEIAEKLTISIKTVESHRLNLMKKLDAHSVVDLMKWAIRLNIA
jgi:two-component system secretion response regulator SsrB